MTGMVKGNGMTLGLTDGTNNAGLADVDISESSDTLTSRNGYGQAVGTSYSGSSSSLTQSKMISVTTDETKSGIVVVRNNSKYLNFYIN